MRSIFITVITLVQDAERRRRPRLDAGGRLIPPQLSFPVVSVVCGRLAAATPSGTSSSPNDDNNDDDDDDDADDNDEDS